MDPELAEKLEFNRGLVEGAYDRGEKLNFDDLRMFGLSQMLAQALGKSCPMLIRAEAEAMDKLFREAKELSAYIDERKMKEIEDLARPQRFAPPGVNERNQKKADELFEELVQDAREKKAQAEKAAKEEAEYQARKAANRQTRASAPPPDEKPLPAVGKALKKDDDEFAAYSGAGAGKKAGKRK